MNTETQEKFTFMLNTLDRMVKALPAEHRSHNFINSVATQMFSTACISPRQWEAVLRIAEETVLAQEIILEDNFAPTYMMLVLAGEHMKYPKMQFRINEQADIALIFSTEHKYARLTNAYAKSNWQYHFTYGELGMDGKMRIKPSAVRRPEWPDVLAFLNELAKDPIQAAKTSAARTGRCTYCWSELTDARSKDVGYGPVCAGHWHLPWGDTLNRSVDEMLAHL